jgi:Predicted membrane protein
MKKLTKVEIVNSIIDDVDNELQDEEMIHLILENRISEMVDTPEKEKETFGQRMADKIAKLAGSWAFIITFIIILALWIGVNMIAAKKSFDPYPFILLNLVLSCVAALQAPLIMMSQNRQEAKDRKRAENDYKVNLKTEIIIQDVHSKLDQILENQETLLKNKEAASNKQQLNE